MIKQNERSEQQNILTHTYDALYQLTGATGTTHSKTTLGNPFTSTYSQVFEFDGLGLGNMMRKTSSESMNPSALSTTGDNLNYNFEYKYAKTTQGKDTHRAVQIGGRYYRYDANGNLIAEQSKPFTEADIGEHAVIQVEGDTYATDYDWGAQNPDGDSSTSAGAARRDYTWNERNLMKRSIDSAYTVNYTYGADGERSNKYAVSSSNTNTETLYFNKLWAWHYDGTMGDLSGDNSKHIYFGDTRIATKISNPDTTLPYAEQQRQYFYHSDHLGSAQLVTDYQGKQYEHIEYTPYGELWIEIMEQNDQIDIPYRFTGKQRDTETGLYYFGARYLDARTSRWLSTDPALGDYIPGAPVSDEASTV
jgi:RHS repeat-associated protein